MKFYSVKANRKKAKTGNVRNVDFKEKKTRKYLYISKRYTNLLIVQIYNKLKEFN